MLDLIPIALVCKDAKSPPYALRFVTLHGVQGEATGTFAYDIPLSCFCIPSFGLLNRPLSMMNMQIVRTDNILSIIGYSDLGIVTSKNKIIKDLSIAVPYNTDDVLLCTADMRWVFTTEAYLARQNCANYSTYYEQVGQSVFNIDLDSTEAKSICSKVPYIRNAAGYSKTSQTYTITSITAENFDWYSDTLLTDMNLNIRIRSSIASSIKLPRIAMQSSIYLTLLPNLRTLYIPYTDRTFVHLEQLPDTNVILYTPPAFSVFKYKTPDISTKNCGKLKITELEFDKIDRYAMRSPL